LDRLTQIDLFVRIAELGSITRAAALLGLSDSVASRALHAHEERLGVRLLERTTRRLWLTEAGQAYYERCAKLLEAVQVEFPILDEEEVARGTGLHAVAAEELPQMRDVDLERLVRRSRGVVVPERANEIVGRDGTIGGQEKRAEERALLRAAQLERPAVREHLQGPEDPELHDRWSVRPRGRLLQPPHADG
jgi:molybdenum-dependent DNA-binding transcriptional regulator ModE